MFQAIAGKLAGVALEQFGNFMIKEIALDLFLQDVGLADKPIDFEGWFQKIETQLTAIKNELNDIEKGIDYIKLQTEDIQIDIDDAKLQNILAEYVRDANKIRGVYSTYQAAISDLSDKDPNTQNAGGHLLYDQVLKNDQRMEEVHEAMLNVGTYLLGDGGAFKGILSYLPNVLDAQLSKDAHDYAKLPPAGTKGLDGLTDSLAVYKCYPDAYLKAIGNTVVPTFQSVLFTLIKGMTLLEAAWVGTIEEKKLDDHVNNVKAVCSIMASFWEDQTKPEIVQPKLVNWFNNIGRSTVPQGFRDQNSWLIQTCAVLYSDPPTPKDSPFPQEVDKYLVVSCPSNIATWFAQQQLPASLSGPAVLIPGDFGYGTAVWPYVLTREDVLGRTDHFALYDAQHMSNGPAPQYTIPPLEQLVRAGNAPKILADLSQGLREKLLQPSH